MLGIKDRDGPCMDSARRVRRPRVECACTRVPVNGSTWRLGGHKSYINRARLAAVFTGSNIIV